MLLSEIVNIETIDNNLNGAILYQNQIFTKANCGWKKQFILKKIFQQQLKSTTTYGMRKTLFIYLLTFFIWKADGQILTPVKWSYAAKKIADGEAIIFLKATIDAPWHIYSINQLDGGPVKTTFSFTNGKGYELLGNVIEPRPLTKHEDVFKMDVHYFATSVIFQQKIKLKAKQTTVKGKVEFMTCNAEKCLPPDEVVFNIPVK